MNLLVTRSVEYLSNWVMISGWRHLRFIFLMLRETQAKWTDSTTGKRKKMYY